MDFGALIRTLETEVDIYKEFTEIEKNKTDVIVKGDIEELDKILNTEQMLNMKAQSVEKKRLEIMKNLNLESKTLVDVIDLAEGNEKEKLSGILDSLHAYIDSLKQINGYNVKLVNSRLDIISSVTKMFKDPAPADGIAGGRNNKSEKIYGKNAKAVDQTNDFEPPMIKKKI